MTGVTVAPGAVAGRATAPPSKSYTHRALVAGHLSGRRFRVDRPLDSEDTRRTAAAITALGTPVTYRGHAWTIEPERPRRRSHVSIDCGESGTTLRFIAPLAVRRADRVRLTGRAALGRRPMEGLLRALRELGATTRVAPSGFPLDLSGPLHGGRVSVDGSTSSQFISSLLLTLPSLAEDSRVDVVGEPVSRPYIEATLAVLHRLGVDIVPRSRSFQVPGGQRVRGRSFRVPGDASSAAYLWVAAALSGGPVRVDGIDPAWPQADRRVLELLRTAGADVRSTGSSVTVRARARRPFTVDLTDAPDLYPLAGVLAAVTPGRSRLRGASHVVHKESDRGAETARLARAFGARTARTARELTIDGTRTPRPVRLKDLYDHRLMMSAAVGALVASGPSRLGPAEAVSKSFPGFWDALTALGAEVVRR